MTDQATTTEFLKCASWTLNDLNENQMVLTPAEAQRKIAAVEAYLNEIKKHYR